MTLSISNGQRQTIKSELREIQLSALYDYCITGKLCKYSHFTALLLFRLSVKRIIMLFQ